MLIPFHKAQITSDDISSVTRVLAGGWLTMGERCFEFEREFARVCGVTEAISLVSCTAALHLALVDAGVGPGDEVIIPTTTFVAAHETVLYTGATPVIVDVETTRHTIDIDCFEKAITPRTKAVIPVHFAGMPCQMDRLCEIARAHHIIVIEDAAHAFPSYCGEQMCGSMGDYGCFSFYATKTLTTGEGGMLVLNDKDRADRIRRLRLHGISRDAWKRYAADGSPHYDVTETGYKYNMTDTAAALGLSQLQRYQQAHKLRESVCARYDKIFGANESFEIMPEAENTRSARHLYVLKLNLDRLTISRDRFCEILKQKGVHTSLHFIPLHRFTAIRTRHGDMYLPNADSVFERSVSLPLYPDLSDEEVDYVIASVVETAKEFSR